MNETTQDAFPQNIGPYQVIRSIRHGGFSSILSARHLKTGERVALRVLLPQYRRNWTARRRFRQAAKILSKLDHPNWIRFHAFGRHRSFLYTAMEIVDGPSLSAALAAGNPEIRQNAHTILIGTARALSYLHNMGWLQLDHKPENILIGPDLQAKLIDLDLALPVPKSGGTRKIKKVSGTPAYIAPECWSIHRVSEQTDIFAFGVTAFEVLTGRKPWGGDLHDLARAYGRQAEPAPRVRSFNDTVSTAVDNVVARCLALAPADRYPNMHLVVRDLEAVTSAANRPEIHHQHPADTEILGVR